MVAPSAAPEDTPRMSGETSGLRKRPWYAEPAAASVAPMATAASTRGPRTRKTTVSIAAGSAVGAPVSLAQSRVKSSVGETG